MDGGFGVRDCTIQYNTIHQVRTHQAACRALVLPTKKLCPMSKFQVLHTCTVVCLVPGPLQTNHSPRSGHPLIALYVFTLQCMYNTSSCQLPRPKAGLPLVLENGGPSLSLRSWPSKNRPEPSVKVPFLDSRTFCCWRRQQGQNIIIIP